jgi:hypothetical protein
MVESYNLLLLMQFEGFQTTESDAQIEYTAKVKEVDQKLVDINRLRDKLLFEHNSMQELLASKDKEVKQAQAQITFLENQLKETK